MLFQQIERTPGVTSAKIDGIEQLGQAAFCQHVGTVRCIQQRVAKTCIKQVLVNLLYILAVDGLTNITKRAVLVLHLHRENSPPARGLQRSQLLPQTHQPMFCRTHEDRIIAAQYSIRIAQQPGRITTQVPLSAKGDGMDAGVEATQERLPDARQAPSRVSFSLYLLLAL